MAFFQMGTERFARLAKPEWASMESGTGDREFVIPVRFSEEFVARPDVSVSLQLLDSFGNVNQRFSLSADAVDKEGFNLVLFTWANTRIFQIGASWIAIDSRLTQISSFENLEQAKEGPVPTFQPVDPKT